MRRIAIINQKGGVGKTTTSVNLGAALAEQGRRVVIVDLDPQANLSLHLGIEPRTEERSTYTVLHGASTFGEALRPTSDENLRVLPSNIDLSGAELELASAIGRDNLLSDAIEDWIQEYAKSPAAKGGYAEPADYVIFDCPPSLGLLSVNALAAANEVVITVQTEFLALMGMSKLVDIVTLIQRRLNPGLKITGIAPCLYDSRLRLAREVLGEVRKFFPGQVFRQPIRSNVKLAEAPSFGASIIEYAPESNGALDYRRLALEMIAQEKDHPDLANLPAPKEISSLRTVRTEEGTPEPSLSQRPITPPPAGRPVDRAPASEVSRSEAAKSSEPEAKPVAAPAPPDKSATTTDPTPLKAKSAEREVTLTPKAPPSAPQERINVPTTPSQTQEERRARIRLDAVEEELIYLDHNGTTPIDPRVRDRYLELLDEKLGNASSTHASGRRARAVIDEAREQIAAALQVPEDWIVFTSGGTEANNLALRGVLRAAGPGSGLLISAIEHSSVREPAQELAHEGHPLTTIPVNSQAALSMDELGDRLRDTHCHLVSIMTANNEVGAVTPMAEVAQRLAACGANRPVWHSDAVQALGKIDLRIREWGTDLTSFSAHKIGGPQGVGFLIRRAGLSLPPLLLGGGQEGGQRAGTENAAGIGATAMAVSLACEHQADYAAKMIPLLTTLWHGLSQLSPRVRLIGPAIDATQRLPNTLNVLFEGVDGRILIARLDLEGIEASLGSACSSGALEPSHVLTAMGLDEERARAGLRLSLGRSTTSADIHSAVDIVGKVLNELSC